MIVQTLKKECVCNAEIYLAKKHIIKRPILSWNRVFDLQDKISYVIEFDGKEYTENISFQNEKKAVWEIPFDLELKKIYKWRVKAFDGYEYSDYSPYQYVQRVNNDLKTLPSFINIKTDNRKNSIFSLNSAINVTKTTFNSEVFARLSVEHVKKFLPCKINVDLSKNTFLQSSIDITKRDEDFLKSEIFISTKNILPPKGPLGVDMQSEFDYVTGNQSPTFSWWKSLDEIFSENIVYEIQISTNVMFSEDIVFEMKNIKNPISEQMVYPLPIKLDRNTYYWRVRAFDGINYSKWVYGSQFTIGVEEQELNAEICVMNNFVRNAILSEVTIKERQTLESEINVLANGNLFLPGYTSVWSKKSEKLDCDMFILFGPIEQIIQSELEIYRSQLLCETDVYKSTAQLFIKSELEIYRSQILSEVEIHESSVKYYLDSELNVLREKILDSEISIEHNENPQKIILDSEIFVKRREMLSAKVDIIPVGFNTLHSNLSVLYNKEEFLKSKLYVFDKNFVDGIYAELNILENEKISFKCVEDIFSEIYVFRKHENEDEDTINPILNYKELDLFGYVYVNKKDEEIKPEGEKESLLSLQCNIDVKSMKLYPVNIYCNQDSENWFNNELVQFTWKPHESNDFLNGYIMQFNNIIDYNPELGKDYYLHANGEKIFNARIFDISGEYYFHICGFDKYYRKTPVSHYKVLYNNIPEPPENLSINGVKFYESQKILSRYSKNIFSWDNSYDKDQNDFVNLKYEMIICNSSRFDRLDYSSELAQDNFIEISFENMSLSGKYFWKVRAFDGKQYSEWSKIATFIVNKEPTIPTDIKFSSK